jgi:D-glycero-D-manno-heptose 1,7-bisphosphate phosphatase
MMEEIGRRFGMDMKGVPVVGDALRDLQAGAALDMQPILVRTGKGQDTLAAGNLPEGTLVFANLAEAVQHIISES